MRTFRRYGLAIGACLILLGLFALSVQYTNQARQNAANRQLCTKPGLWTYENNTVVIMNVREKNPQTGDSVNELGFYNPIGQRVVAITTNHDRWYEKAVWSPDGTYLVALVQQANKVTIWRMKPDGTQMKPLYTFPEHTQPSANISVTTDNTIIFDSLGRIWALSSSGGDPHVIAGLPEDVDVRNVHPYLWYPSAVDNGKKISFRSQSTQSENTYRTMVMNLDGLHLEDISPSCP